jgi:hypothetical protein
MGSALIMDRMSFCRKFLIDIKPDTVHGKPDYRELSIAHTMAFGGRGWLAKRQCIFYVRYGSADGLMAVPANTLRSSAGK